MEDFFEKLSKIKFKYYDENDSINIFNIMFQGHEEVNLHSRFISYLLSLKEYDFLNLFVRNILNLDEKQFNILDCEIIPNKDNKSEYEEIDILIFNRKERQAIIIENKINADDSIHDTNDIRYKGQLDRYYYTIVNGEDKNKKKLEIQCEKTFVFYLTLYKPPSETTMNQVKKNGIFIPEKHILNYYHIQDWLNLCFKKDENTFLNTIINQYLNLVKKMTTDNETVMKITNLIAENKDYTIDTFLLMSHFNDIKWHTIHRFFSELSNRFKCRMPDNEIITNIAHNNKKKSILKLEFDFMNSKIQIVYDEKGFTLGNLDPSIMKWDLFETDKIKKIDLINFSNLETFKIINNEFRYNVIDEIERQIIKHRNENYVNLKNIF